MANIECNCDQPTPRLWCPIHEAQTKDIANIADLWKGKYYDKVEELNRIESAVTGGMAVALERIKRLEAAMTEIKRYSTDPFDGDKWRNYIRELATEVLK